MGTDFFKKKLKRQHFRALMEAWKQQKQRRGRCVVQERFPPRWWSIWYPPMEAGWPRCPENAQCAGCQTTTRMYLTVIGACWWVLRSSFPPSGLFVPTATSPRLGSRPVFFFYQSSQHHEKKKWWWWFLHVFKHGHCNTTITMTMPMTSNFSNVYRMTWLNQSQVTAKGGKYRAYNVRCDEIQSQCHTGRTKRKHHETSIF